MHGTPANMESQRRWMLWQNIDGRKVPCMSDGRPASATDPATWTDHEHAVKVVGRFSGLGFALGDGWAGVDLDSCRNPETGDIHPAALAIIDSLDSYAEVSPSGTGVKIFLRTSQDLPSGVNRKVDWWPSTADGKEAGVELYSGGRYFCLTGEHWEGSPLDPMDRTEKLHELYRRLTETKKAAEVRRPATIQTSRVDIVERARGYLAKMNPAVSGNRGHDATFRAAAVLFWGFGLNDCEGRSLLDEFNLKCQPPWSAKELDHKWASVQADKYGEGKPRGWMLASNAAVNRYHDYGADLSRLLGHIAAVGVDLETSARDPNGPRNPGPFPAEHICPPGLIGGIVEHNLSTALYPQPVLALAGALAVMAVITGHKIRDERDTRTNIMVLALARSGAGKEHARKLAKLLLTAAGAADRIGPDALVSGAGFVNRLARQPVTLFQPDEVQGLIRQAGARGASHIRQLCETLKSSYSSASSSWTPTAYADANHNRTIDQPHAVLHATGVPDQFWQHCDQDLIESGFLGRMLLFEPPEKLPRYCEAVHRDPPAELVAAVREWLEWHPGGNLADQHPRPHFVPVSPDAAERMRRHLVEIRERQEHERGVAAALWSRSGEKSNQLSLILAASRCGPDVERLQIELQDVERAIAINNWSTRRIAWHATEHAADSEYGRLALRVLAAISDQQWTPKSIVTRRTQGVDRRTRDGILDDLKDSQRIEEKDTPKGRAYRRSE